MFVLQDVPRWLAVVAEIMQKMLRALDHVGVVQEEDNLNFIYAKED